MVSYVSKCIFCALPVKSDVIRRMMRVIEEERRLKAELGLTKTQSELHPNSNVGIKAVSALMCGGTLYLCNLKNS